MVSLQSIRRSNEQIPDELTKRVVALFVGATGGIGMGTMKRLAELLKQPCFYFVGRSLEDGERVADELAKINPEGEYTFIQADISLLKNVDQVCRQIAKAEKSLNILFLTAGTLELKTKTAEGLHTATALAYYSRMRFIANMLPLLQRADSLRRVVSVFAGTKEGKVDRGDWQGENANLYKWRAQTASMMTMGLVRMQETAPSVSFVHDYPGVVKTGITRGLKGIVRVLVDCYVSVERTPLELSADFHVFLATSARFTSDKTAGFLAGVGIPKVVDTGRGFFVGKSVEGREGGGVYSVNETGQTSAPLVGGPDYGPPPKVQKLMEGFRKDGSVWDLWDHTHDEFKRITGSESI